MLSLFPFDVSLSEIFTNAVQYFNFLSMSYVLEQYYEILLNIAQHNNYCKSSFITRPSDSKIVVRKLKMNFAMHHFIKAL